MKHCVKTMNTKYEQLLLYDCTQINDSMVRIIKSFYGQGNGATSSTLTYLRCLHKFVGIRDLETVHRYEFPSITDFLYSFNESHQNVREVIIVGVKLGYFSLDSDVYLQFPNVSVWTSDFEFEILDLQILFHNIHYFSLTSSIPLVPVIKLPKKSLYEKLTSWMAHKK